MNQSAQRRPEPADPYRYAADRAVPLVGWVLLAGFLAVAVIVGLWVAGVSFSTGDDQPQANDPSLAENRTPAKDSTAEPPAPKPAEPKPPLASPAALVEPPTPPAQPAEPTPRPTAASTVGEEVEVYVPPSAVETLAKEEIEVVARLIEAFPNDPEPLSLMGNVRSKHGDNSEAVKYWRKCIDLAPGRATSYSAMGMVALLHDDHAKAASLWRKMLELDPKIASGRYRLAQALIGMGELDEAVEELHKDIRLSPTACNSFCVLGQVYLQLKDYEKARQNYETAIRLRPRLSDAHFGLATASRHLKQLDKFKLHMAKFKQLKAGESKADRLRRDKYDDLDAMRPRTAGTYAQAAQYYFTHRMVPPAEKLWRRAARLDRNNVASRNALASLCEATGRLSEAAQFWRELCDLLPDNAMCHARLGGVHAQMGQFGEAEKAFAKACQLAPKHPAAHRALAQVYLQTRRNLPEALALAKKAVELDPEASSYFVLAVACENNNDHAAALAAIRQAITLDPNNAKYRQTHVRLQQRK